MGRVGRPRATEGPPTRDRIVAAAVAAFAEKGLGGATLAEIGARAGIRRSSLLHHYATKEVLYAQIVRGAFERLTALLVAPMAADLPFEARLEALVVAYAGYFRENPDHARIIIREMLELDGPGTAILRTEIAPLLDTVLVFLAQEGKGIVRPDVPLRAAVMSVAADVMLQNASGALGPAMWGERSVAMSWALTRFLVLPDRRSP